MHYEHTPINNLSKSQDVKYGTVWIFAGFGTLNEHVADVLDTFHAILKDEDIKMLEERYSYASYEVIIKDWRENT